MQLLPFHPNENLAVRASVERQGSVLRFTFEIDGAADDILIPPPAPARRTDELWRSTCFEAFVATGPLSYLELNFAPSGQWAAYSFANYRSEMSDVDLLNPKIEFGNNRLLAEIELPHFPSEALGLSAVIEHKDGRRSYWALAHPDGVRPDFHLRDCFIAKLP